MRQIAFILIILCCISSCKNNHKSNNKILQISHFFKKNGDDFVSEKDLNTMVILAQNKIKEDITNIYISKAAPPIPPKKDCVEIAFPRLQKEKSEIRRFISFKHLRNNSSSYMGRKQHDDGKWYSEYSDGESVAESEKFEWILYSVEETEFYKITIDDTIVYHRAFKDLTFERIQSILLFLKANNYKINTSNVSIRKDNNGFKVEIPSEKDRYEGIWLRIIENDGVYKIIEKGEYDI